MRRFRDGEIDVLVATTVIEVGIDVAERDGDADRASRALRPVAAAPAARPRGPRRRGVVLHPARRRRAPRRRERLRRVRRHRGRLRDRARGPAAARHGRPVRRAAERRARRSASPTRCATSCSTRRRATRRDRLLADDPELESPAQRADCAACSASATRARSSCSASAELGAAGRASRRLDARPAPRSPSPARRAAARSLRRAPCPRDAPPARAGSPRARHCAARAPDEPAQDRRLGAMRARAAALGEVRRRASRCDSRIAAGLLGSSLSSARQYGTSDASGEPGKRCANAESSRSAALVRDSFASAIARAYTARPLAIAAVGYGAAAATVARRQTARAGEEHDQGECGRRRSPHETASSSATRCWPVCRRRSHLASGEGA